MDALDRQARTAGWLYLLLVIPGPFVLIYLPSKLIVRGDAAATAANLLAHETLFRFGMVADVAGSVFFVMLVYRSGFLPRLLGAWLVVNGAAYVALSGIGLMRPELSGKAFLYAQPLLFGELAIMLWLIIKGAKQKPLAATA